jgi:putative transposase
VAQITRKHGISAATYYHWKSKYSGAAVSERKRLRELEGENAKLKRMYADLALEKGCSLPKTLTPSAKREAIRIMTEEHGVPIVRACQATRLSRAAYYRPWIDRAARDVEVIAALQAIVIKEQRWGFWKCHDRLRAQSYGWNHKRVWRVYCQLRLNLPRRTKRRVLKRERQPLWVEPRLNAVWALDFMRDTLYSGRVFRTLNVIDEANRGALGIDVAVSIPAARVTTFLAQMIDRHGRPAAIRCDNGPELTSQAFSDWCNEQKIQLRFIQPGKPDQNAYIERFNRTYREEVRKY